MAKAYSMDLRKRVIAACESGMSVQDAATVYRITARTIFDWLRRKRETGSFAPKTGKPGPRNKLANHLDTLREIIRDQPDATLREIRDRLPVRVGIMTISRALTSLNITLKKKSFTRRNSIVPTFSFDVNNGARFDATGILKRSYSWTKPGRKRI